MPRLRVALLVAVSVTALASVATAQPHGLRDRVRDNGDLALSPVISCGPPVGLKEVIEYTQLTVQGVVSRADSALTPEEDSLYTDYLIDVIRIFRIAPALLRRSTPGATAPSPFVGAAPVSRSGAIPMQIRVRAVHHGRVAFEGGAVTQSTEFRMLTPGEHVIVSAHYTPELGLWRPFGVFTVRDGRVILLERRLQVGDYESVTDFASALANPPQTPER